MYRYVLNVDGIACGAGFGMAKVVEKKILWNDFRVIKGISECEGMGHG